MYKGVYEKDSCFRVCMVVSGSLTMSAYVSLLYNGPVGYKVSGNTTMVFNYPNGGNNLYGENIMHFQLADTVLTITPPSVEYVVEKYIRVQ